MEKPLWNQEDEELETEKEPGEVLKAKEKLKQSRTSLFLKE